MIAEQIVYRMLDVPGLNALVSDRIFSSSAKQNAKPPYLVFEVLEDVSYPNLNIQEPVRHDAHVRIYALDLGQVKIGQMNEAIKTALNFKFYIVVDGKTVIESRLKSVNPMEKDHETGIFIQATDYILRYYE